MPQLERRLYQPSDDIRGFDAEEGLEDEGSRLPLLIVIALVVLASFAGVVWLAYTQGVQRGRQDAPRIMAAEPEASPAKSENPYADLKVYQQTKPQADTDDDTPPPPPTEVKPKAAAPAEIAPKAPPPSVMASANPPAPAVAKSTPPPVATTKRSPSVAPKPLQPSPATPAISMPPVPATGAPRSIMPSAVQTAATPQRLPAPAAAKPSAPPLAPAPATQTAAPGAAGFVLQIGSYTSDAEANASWQTYRAAHSSVAGYAPDVQKADLGKKGTWYRLRVGPFGTMAEASAACARLKAQGGNCFATKR